MLTFESARKIVAAAEVEAKKRGSTVVIVVVDDGGYPIVVYRLDDTQVASVEVGIGKARTAAIFRRPSRRGGVPVIKWGTSSSALARSRFRP